MEQPDSSPAPAALLADVRARMARAAEIARRDPAGITLVAVSKTHPAEAITPLLAAGQRVFGENRVQEAQAKWPALRERWPDLALHLVGQLQSNKADDAVRLFDCIHSLDRPSLVAALARAMDKCGRRVDCFVQVNIGAEAQKGGCAMADLPALLAEARAADLPLAGLMCVPPAGLEAAPYFALLAKLANEPRCHRSLHGHVVRLRDGDRAGRHPCSGRQRDFRASLKVSNPKQSTSTNDSWRAFARWSRGLVRRDVPAVQPAFPAG
jgi:hypothetical protein